MSSVSSRYALYFAPDAGTALWTLGCAWLGRDARTGRTLPTPQIPDIPESRIARITRSPSHYGFHATLKAPFRLAEGYSEAMLKKDVSAFARKRKPFVIPKLCVKDLHGFLALRPAIMPPALEDLAADCVRDFDKFRAPLAETAMAKRLSAGLTDRQVALLRRWGYPYVLDEFRFHLTLTDTLTEEENETIKPVLSELFHRVIAEPIAVSAITIFVQPSECEPFTVLARYRFGR